MRTVAVALVVAACSFKPGTIPDRDDAATGSVDAPLDSAEVLTDTPLDMNQPVDSPVAVCVAAPCLAAGGTCVMDVCEIDNNTQLGVTCPDGMPCKVLCDTTSACKAGVDCAGATSCDVRCFGSSTCQDTGVDCGQAATCTVYCGGSSSCQHGENSDASVECRNSMCTVTCDGASACQDGIDVDAGGNCRSHCCGGGCEAGFDDCVNDNVCS